MSVPGGGRVAGIVGKPGASKASPAATVRSSMPEARQTQCSPACLPSTCAAPVIFLRASVLGAATRLGVDTIAAADTKDVTGIVVLSMQVKLPSLLSSHVDRAMCTWSCAIHASGALLRAIAAAPVDGCTQPALPFSCSLLPLSTLWLCAPPFCGTAFTNSLDNVRMIVTFISTTMVAHYGGTQEQTIVLKIQGNHRP